MKKITLLLLLTLSILGAKAQTTYTLNYDSIRVGKVLSTNGISLYGKVFLKHVPVGSSSDSILTIVNGRIKKVASVPAVSFTTFGSTPNANGASISSGVITLQPASATHPGGITLGAQTLGSGLKTFTTGIQAGVSVNTPTVALLNGANTTSLTTLSTGSRLVSFPDAAGTVALTSDLSSYLPLSGGTMTGTLTVNNDLFLTRSTGHFTTFSIASTGSGLGSILYLERPASTETSKIIYKTGATQKWQIGSLAGTENYSIRNATLASDALSVDNSNNNITLTGALTGTTASFTSATDGIVGTNRSSTTYASIFKNATAGVDNWAMGQPTGASTNWSLFNYGLNAAAFTANYATNAITFNGTISATNAALTTPNIGAASGTSLNLTGLTASSAVATDGSKNLVSVTNTGTGNNVLASSPTITTPTISGKPTVTGGLYGEYFNGTANTLFFDNGSTGATTEFVIRANGSGGVRLTSGATSWAAVSDENTKVMTEWKAFVNPLDKVATLRAGTSRYKKDQPGVSRPFLIAQDVQKVLPEAVSATESGELILRYTDVIPLLVGALQEEKTKREALEKRLAALEARITQLENK